MERFAVYVIEDLTLKRGVGCQMYEFRELVGRFSEIDIQDIINIEVLGRSTYHLVFVLFVGGATEGCFP